jgi:hypothetical protein
LKNVVKMRKKKSKRVEKKDVEAYLKKLPPPPPEHVHELKMEKQLKQMIKEQEARKAKKKN